MRNSAVNNFPHGLASYGIPIVGNAPMTPANYYFADKRRGAAGNGGRSIDDALNTIEAAITLMNNRITWTNSPWANMDILVIAPGLYAENLTALPYGCTIIGLGDAFDINGERGVTIKPSSGSPVDVTSCINSRIENICFASPDTSPCFDVENLNRNIIVNCVFAGLPGASPSTTHGLRVKDETASDGNGDMTGNIIHGCKFLVVRNGLHVTTDNGSSKQASGNIIEYCYVAGADQTGIYFHPNCVPSYTQINNCVIGDGGTTLALGLDDNTGIVNVSNTMFTATACDPASADSDSKYNSCYLNGTLMT